MIQRILRFLSGASALSITALAILLSFSPEAILAQTDDDEEANRGPVLQLPAAQVRQENLKTINSPHNDARPTISC